MIRDASAADAAGIGAVWNPIIIETDITFWPTPRSDAEIAVAAGLDDRMNQAATGLRGSRRDRPARSGDVPPRRAPRPATVPRAR